MAHIDNLKPYALPYWSPATISFTLEPFDQLLAAARHEGQPPQHFVLSPAVRVGPLDVSVKAFLFKQPSGEPDICCDIINDSAFTGFSWIGKVSDSSRFRILDAEGHVKFQEEKYDINIDNDTVWAWSDFPTRVGGFSALPLTGASALKNCVDNNAIHIQVSMSVWVCSELLEEDQGHQCIEWRIPLSLLSTKKTIPSNLALLESNKWSDVVIVPNDGDGIPAHRVILARSSPVFETMFSTDMKENLEGVVNIPYMGTKALKVMLKFIYTGGFREEIENLKIGTGVFLEVVHAGSVYVIPLLMRYAGLALLLRCEHERMKALEIFSTLKQYGEVMRETLAQLAKFIKDNIQDMVDDSD